MRWWLRRERPERGWRRGWRFWRRGTSRSGRGWRGWRVPCRGLKGLGGFWRRADERIALGENETAVFKLRKVGISLAKGGIKGHARVRIARFPWKSRRVRPRRAL